MHKKSSYYNKELKIIRPDYLITHSNIIQQIMIIKQPKYSKKKLSINLNSKIRN
jgi:hypothetical protein